jgi:hypothetical protein
VLTSWGEQIEEQLMFLTTSSANNFQRLVTLLKHERVTLFIGAGLSASRQPTWKALHAKLQLESGLRPTRNFDPPFAPADFADFRDAIPTERYLALLREQFGGPVTSDPGLYRFLDETNGFEQLVTTNFDEFLASIALSNNRKPRIAVYPELKDVGARYVYLHGRAEFAQLPSDLVLCEDDYARAYETPGRAKNMLKALFSRPCLFVGSSLQDPELFAILRQRIRLAGNQDLDPLSEFFAVMSVRSREDDEGDTAADAETLTCRLNRFGVSTICYASDATHSRLRAIVLQLRHEVEQRPREVLFFERSRRLERLGRIANPTSAHVQEVRELIRGIPDLARDFFSRSNVASGWYDVLRDSIIIQGVVEPWDLGDGRTKIDPWTASPFVQRIAAERPEVAVDLIQRLSNTKNWHAQAVMTGLTQHLSGDQLREVLPVLAEWMDSDYDRLGRVAEQLIPSLEQLTAHGDQDTALVLLGELLSPLPIPNQTSATLRIPDYWLSRVAPVIERLITGSPQPTYKLLIDRLRAAASACGERYGQYSSVWRPAIEDHEQNNPSLDDALTFLINWTRDALVAWIATDLRSAAAEVAQLMESTNNLLQRLALHCATVQPELVTLLGRPVVTPELMLRDEAFHEVAVLVSKRFGDLDPESRSRVHQIVRSGPYVDQDDETGLHRDRWRWRWLAIIPGEHQTAEERSWWKALSQKFGFPDEPFFMSWTTRPQAWEMVEDEQAETVEPDPIRAALQSGGPEALLTALRTNGGGAVSLKQLVQDDPQGLLALAPLLRPEDGYLLSWFLDAYESLLRDKSAVTFDWSPLIALIQRLASVSSKEMSSVAIELGHLVSSGTASDHNPIPVELLGSTIEAMAAVISNFAKPLGALGEDDLLRRDHQLNNPAGASADAFMRCIWRKLILASNEELRLPYESLAWITAALDAGWGGREMRHALGEFWFVLRWTDPSWLGAHVDQLWPQGDDPSVVNARHAFLHGFLQASQWTSCALLALRPMFADAIHDLSLDRSIHLDRAELKQALARYLVLGWLYEVEGYDFDGLIGQFVEAAPDADRARFVRQLGRTHRFKRDDSAVDLEDTRERRERYWKRRVDALRKTLPVFEPSEELSAFCSWPIHASESLRRLESRLAVSTDHLTGGDAGALLKIIAIKAEAEPLPAIRLLLRMADRLITTESMQFWIHSRELEAAIASICRSARPRHRSEIRKIQDRFVMAGQSRIAEHLENCARPERTARGPHG